MKRQKAFFFAFIFLILVTPCLAETGEIQGFGMGTSTGLRLKFDERKMNDAYQEMKEIGVRWTREEFRTEDTENDFFYQDNLKMLKIIQRNGINVVGVIDYGVNQAGLEDREFLNQWKKRVERIVKEFGPYVSIWEVGNQMNIKDYWTKVRPEAESINPEFYAEMFKYAKKIVKKYDKSAKISIGALSAFIGEQDIPPLSYLTQLCKKVKASDVDYLSIHVPIGPYFPEDDQSVRFAYLDERIVNMKTYIEDLIAGMKNNCRWDKDVIISAVGYRAADLQTLHEKSSIPLDRIEAHALSRIYPSFLSIPQVSAVYWYSMVADETGDSVIGQNSKVAYLDTTVRIGGSIPLGKFDVFDSGDTPLLGYSQYRFRNNEDLVISFWANQQQFETNDAVFIGKGAEPLTNIPLTFIGERPVSENVVVGKTLVSVTSIANYVFGPYREDLRLTVNKNPLAASTGEMLNLTESGAIRDRDGMEMVFVPAGEFTMGDESNNYDNYGPPHQVFLDEYWIDKYEVSNDQYKKCIAAGACSKKIGSDNSKLFFENEKYGNYPLTTIYWEDAKKYCEWVGASLPTEAQWEKAARGTDERQYPWGDTKDFNNVSDAKANFNYDDCWRSPEDFEDKDGYCFTAPVDSYPKGVSPYGAYNMVGNAMEWVNDYYSENYYRESPLNNPTGPESGSYHVIRGGSFMSFSWASDQMFNRMWGNGSGDEDGFRCAISKESPNYIEHPAINPIAIKEKKLTEADGAQAVYDYLFDCMLKYASPTGEENVYTTDVGNLIKVIEQDPFLPSKNLSEADLANGMVWDNAMYIKAIVKFVSRGENEWKDKKLYFNFYKYYSDGRIKAFDPYAYTEETLYRELTDGLCSLDGDGIIAN